MALPRKKTTVYLDPEILRSAKILAAASGRHDYEIIEDAIRDYVRAHGITSSGATLRELMAQLAARSHLSDEEAMQLANDELSAARRERHLGE
jgi:predicted transcriptional regulator